MAEGWALFLGLGLPVIGEVQDFQRRFWIKHTGEVRAQGWPGRLNLAVKVPVQKHAYAMMLVQLGSSPISQTLQTRRKDVRHTSILSGTYRACSEPAFSER